MQPQTLEALAVQLAKLSAADRSKLAGWLLGRAGNS
jgi:hypothetical protein